MQREPVAMITTALRGGAVVSYSSQICKERIDASRDYNLANARIGIISRDKKCDQYFLRYGGPCPFATEITKDQFHIEEVG